MKKEIKFGNTILKISGSNRRLKIQGYNRTFVRSYGRRFYIDEFLKLSFVEDYHEELGICGYLGTSNFGGVYIALDEKGENAKIFDSYCE